ncbi:GNAT family N-acetyltransferase [Cryptosporangium phraense]|uniref:GNAT family N-acetyltransferase n=1 Tax=Cryptosporangium phraense TaxID=2593070 RepID=A0A545AXU8_9ACTN|nr:GNAT family N-acetyltransferase [Cryptosporangium phraense]TQS46150.1 GNAT family N-acetyltransferase [Cryptosporangium phraense]
MTVRDRAAAAWLDAMARFMTASPQGWYAELGGGAVVVSGTEFASLNTVVSLDPTPDLTALETLATDAGTRPFPWSMVVRSDTAADLAARHGRTARHDGPMMTCPAPDVRLPAPDTTIHHVGPDHANAYTTALAHGFGVPSAAFGDLMGGDVLDTPGITGYLASASGRPVATGLGIRSGEMIGVFNVAVVPEARRRGLGRAMTARILSDGFAAGATTAYLQPSADGWTLYESMGFRVVDSWTIFVAG